MTLENKNVVLEMKKWRSVENKEKKGNKHKWGRKWGEEDKGGRDNFSCLPLSSSLMDNLVISTFSLSFLFSPPLQWHCPQNFFPPPSPSSLCHSQPLTPINFTEWPRPTLQKGPPVSAPFTAMAGAVTVTRRLF